MTPPRANRRISSVLRAEAERHEPDLVRIRSRFDVHVAPAPPAPVRRWRRAGAPLVSAVAAGAVAVAAVAGTDLLGALGPPAARPAPSVPAVTGASGPTGSSGPTGTVGPAGTVDPTGTVGPAGSSVPPRTSGAAGTARPVSSLPPLSGIPAGPPPGTPGPGATGALPGLELRQVEAGHPLGLGPDTGLDWVLPGVRPDGTVVRRAAPRVRLPAPVVVPGRAGTSGAPGPFRTSWTGGAPDRARSADPGWLAVDPDGGSVRLDLPASPVRRQLLVHLGTAGADCTVRAWVGDQRATVTLNAPAVAAVATVTVEPGSGPVVIEVVGAARSPGGRFGVAAFELR